MIGKSKWFSPRKYSGWGLTPNCWQGWLYIIIFIIPIALTEQFSFSPNFEKFFTMVWTVLFLVDVFHMMSQIKKDERERLHEAIADRNALWFLMLVLIIWAFVKNTLEPILLVGIIGAMLVKSATHFYLRDK